ncbi:MAG TPA: phytanoyl-CoA dioxygenase family protein [Polyangiaceae bacterium]|nr:phytanoyl-CoA dioxygenase family protein [Polyangiaceae bacterium]
MSAATRATPSTPIAATPASHNPLAAIEALSAALALGETEALHRQLHDRYMQIGRWGRASSHARRAAELSGADYAEWLQVVTLAARGRRSDVVERCVSELEGRPEFAAEDAPALAGIMVATTLDYARRHEWQRVEDWSPLLARLDGLGPGLAASRLIRGFLTARAGDAEQATRLVRDAGKLCTAPRDAGVWADHLRYHHQFGLAETLLRTAREHWPEHPKLLVDHGSVLAELGRPGDALPLWAAVKDEALGRDARLFTAFVRCFLEQRGPTREELQVVPRPEDYTLSAADSPGRLATLLERHGVAIVRGAHSQQDCDELVARLDHNLAHAYDPFVPRDAEDEVNVPLHFLADPGASARLKARFAEIYKEPVGAWHWGLEGIIDTAAIWERVHALTGILAEVKERLGGDMTSDPSLGYARLKQAGQRRVLPFHQDARTGYWEVPTMALWTALTPCGVTAPGLEVVPQRLRSFFPVCLYGGQDRSDYQLYPASAYDELIPEWAVAAPDLGAGDILLFDSFTLHRTQRLPAGHDRRVDFDVRFTSRTPS